MSDNTKIEWTDATWNPVRGCMKISPGCKHCYAETFAERWRGVPGHPFEQGFDLRLVPEKLNMPLRRRKPTTYFVNSMSDLFHEDVPDDYIAAVYGIMAACPQHTFQVLTKRTTRRREWFDWIDTKAVEVCLDHAGLALQKAGEPAWATSRTAIMEAETKTGVWPLPNVWEGFSAEDQERLDERAADALATPAALRFVSAEPLLGPVGLGMWPQCLDGGPQIGWVIVGGESGPGARPMEIAWARSIVAQCRDAGVPCFVKQLGAKPYTEYWEASIEDWATAPLDIEDRKGGDPSEWPEDLRVREMPTPRAA
jgi:protein gp37